MTIFNLQAKISNNKKKHEKKRLTKFLNFLKKTSHLFKIIRKKKENIDLEQIDLTELHWNYFYEDYLEINLRSWAFKENCGHCNSVKMSARKRSA